MVYGCFAADTSDIHRVTYYGDSCFCISGCCVRVFCIRILGGVGTARGSSQNGGVVLGVVAGVRTASGLGLRTWVGARGARWETVKCRAVCVSRSVVAPTATHVELVVRGSLRSRVSRDSAVAACARRDESLMTECRHLVHIFSFASLDVARSSVTVNTLATH